MKVLLPILLLFLLGFNDTWSKDIIILDAITHTRLVKIDITDKELQTHRILILSSGLMELCLGKLGVISRSKK